MTQVVVLYHKSCSWSDNVRSSCSSLSQLRLRALPTGGWCWVFFSNFTPAWPFYNSALWSIFHSRRCIHGQRRRIWDQVHDFYPILPGFHCFCFKTDMVPEDIRYDSVDQHFEVVQHIYTWVVSLTSHTELRERSGCCLNRSSCPYWYPFPCMLTLRL